MLDNEQQVSFTDLWVNAQADVAAYVRAVVRDPHATTDIVETRHDVESFSEMNCWIRSQKCGRASQLRLNWRNLPYMNVLKNWNPKLAKLYVCGISKI